MREAGFKDERVKLRVEDIEQRGPDIVHERTQPREGRAAEPSGSRTN